jgi:hypothetical protein
MMSLGVDNLPTNATAADLRALFRPFGPVTRADVWYGWCLGPGSWVGAVDLESGGSAAVAALDGTEYRGRTLSVSAIEA